MHQKRTVKSPDERRADLLAAAVELFDAKGFDRTTVNAIARAAGMAPGTVYLYFASKEHILRAIHVEYHRTLQAALRLAVEEEFARLADGATTVRDAIGAVVDAVVGAITRQRAATNVISRYVPRLPDDAHDEDRDLVAFVAQALERANAASYVDVSDPLLAAHLVKACIYGPVTRQVVHGDPPHLQPLVAQCKELLVNALVVRAQAPAG